MPYKTILTYLHSVERAKSVLNVAVPLAEKHDAHILGLYVKPHVPLYGMVEVELSREIIDQQRDAVEKDCNDVREIFDQATRSVKDRTEWRAPSCMHSKIGSTIVEHALCCDLVVMSQGDEDHIGSWSNLPADVTIDSGRPTLVIPKFGEFNGIGKKAIVAWNATKEASRAAFDAIPFLEKADSVEVLSINPETEGGHNTMVRGDELAATLARHGVNAEVKSAYNPNISTGDVLLSRAADDGADLIVMGCYGHSRIKETIFGGVSRKLINEMTVPVLMSH